MATIAEQIASYVSERAALVAANDAIMQKAADDGTTLDDQQSEDFDNNEADIAAIDKHLGRLRVAEQRNMEKAVPAAGQNAKEASASRGGAPIIINKSRDAEEKFEGQNYTRMVIAKTLARIEGVSAVGIAQKRWGESNPTLVQVVKAAVEGGGTGTGEWGAELVQADTRYTGDFIDYLYNRTVFDKLPLREVPANVVIKGQDGASQAFWVGESKSIPLTKADFFDISLSRLKVAAIAVISKELLQDSTPSAEMLVRDSLVNASAQRVDTTFFGTGAAVTGVSPAGILNGLVAGSSAGSDVEGVIEDVKALYAGFIAANNADGLEFVTTQSLSKALGLMQNVMGNFAFPGLSANGGALLGDPLTAGGNVGTGDLILLKPSDIYKIGDRGVEVSLSSEAAIEMDSAPAGESDTPTANTSVVSMFQTESVAIKVVRPLNFAKRRASAVAYIGDADYGNPAAS